MQSNNRPIYSLIKIDDYRILQNTHSIFKVNLNFNLNWKRLVYLEVVDVYVVGEVPFIKMSLHGGQLIV